MPKNIDEILKRFLVNIKDILGPDLKEVILYGSYARGDYKSGSDIDIMILTTIKEDNKIIDARNKIYDAAFDIELDYNIIISPLIKNYDEFNSWLGVKAFYNNVKDEGVVLHG